MLVKYLLDETSAAEEQAVKAWIDADASHKKYFEQLRLIWDTSKQMALQSAIDEHKAWERFRGRVAKGGSSTTTHTPKKQLTWTRIAAAIVFLAGIALIGYVLTNSQSTPKEIALTSRQTTLKDTLPDGTILTLNKNTTLTYPERFHGSKRAVKLEGEAFFDVAHDKTKPFTVQVKDVTVMVVGTSFNIKDEKDSTGIVVETGIVQVIHHAGTIELRAGERITIAVNGQPGIKEKVTDKLYNYYRSREFVCEDTPLWKLIQVVNEAYNTNIIIGNEALRNLPINTTFNNESLDQVLNVISLTFNIKIIKQDNKIILQ